MATAKSPYRFYVYQWTNKTNGKRYIGKGTGQRAFRHVWKNPHHANCLLHKAINKYGRDAFDLVTLEDGLTDAESSERERYYIASRGTRAPAGYNLTDGGEGMAGGVHSAETKARMSAAAMGRKRTPETLARMSECRIGVPIPPEVRAKMSATHTGMKRSPETCAAISAGNKGKVRTPEQRARMSASKMGLMKGVPKSPETRERMAAANRARAAREKAARALPPPGTQLVLL